LSTGKRYLSNDFMHDLKSGFLKPLLELVHSDDTLDLQIRNEYFNIYYRGGNLIRINSIKGKYTTFFDRKYLNESTTKVPQLPGELASYSDIQIWCNSVPNMKNEMDLWFAKHHKDEREFQQIMARENNFGRIANGTDYYIADIEYSGIAGRFDLVAIHWPSTGAERKKKIDRALSVIEMKYGDGALKGSSGIIDHIKKLNDLLCDSEKLKQFAEEMMINFNQKHELGLIPDCKHKIDSMSEINDGRLDYIFVIANHDPASRKLFEELKQVQKMNTAAKIRVATSNYSGYGLYDENIYLLDDFIEKYEN
jgi:hypothetical protein